MKRKESAIRSICMILLFLSGIYTTGHAQSFDPNTWYRLTNQWQGEGKSMESRSPGKYYQGVEMGNSADVAWQAWKIISLGNGFFRLICKHTGEANSLSLYKSLPRYSYGAIAPWKRTADQFWKITEWNNGYYRITAWSKTTDSSLTVLNDSKTNSLLYLSATGAYSNQTWMIKPFYPETENTTQDLNRRPPVENTREERSAYGRGTGYAWKFGDKAFSLEDARRRCENENSQGCEKYGAIWYPKCKAGYHASGCCICSPD